MKKILTISSMLFLLTPVFSQDGMISVEDIWMYYKFYANGIDDLRSMNDGTHYTLNEGDTAIVKYSYVNGEKNGNVFSVKQTSGAVQDFTDYAFNDDETAILLTTESQRRYRWATYDDNYIYDTKTHKTTHLSEKGKQMYADFAPAGNRIAYVIDNNLYFKDLNSNTEYQVTTDGEWKHIINGGSDWVYEEEFTLVRSFEWSPDGNMIAFYRFDETEVPEYAMTTYKGNLYPKNYEYKYPKVGEKNSKVEIYIYDIRSKKTTKVNIAKAYEYIPRIKWTADGSALCVFTMNRLQNDLELFLADPNSGETHSMFREQAPKYLEINDDLTFLPDNSGFIWRSEMNGWNHLYLYDMQGKLINQITSGDWDVTEFKGYDAANKAIYFMGTKESIFERHLYVVSLDGKKMKKLTTRNGMNTVDFSKGFTYFINTNSSMLVPDYITLCDNKGKEIRVLEDNKDLNTMISSLKIKKPEYFTFTTSEGVTLNGYMIKPYDFDPNKKYPVFMTLYGGPGSQEVIEGYDGFNMMWHEMLAQKGYIIVCVDNRGTGARGRDFRTVTYGMLGKYETDDQIEAAKWLAKQNYVDGSRIGIWGWSYGGYMSSLCITRGADQFKMAIAVAPVTNWKFYDSIYTERYMGTPESNPNGFDDNAPMAYADKLKGNYLLVHGTGDDNVHFQNSVEWINALIKNNKYFDLMIYPDRNHGIYGGNTRLHLYHLMTDYVMENL
ncbi:MAG: S9 family peptidase [Chitinophagales bacterium]